MKIKKFSKKPSDIKSRVGAKPIICYPNKNIEDQNLSILHVARNNLIKKKEIRIRKNVKMPQKAVQLSQIV